MVKVCNSEFSTIKDLKPHEIFTDNFVILHYALLLLITGQKCGNISPNFLTQ